MAASAPATPMSQVTAQVRRTDSPGTWRHPHFEEVLKRRNATILGDKNLTRVFCNGLVLFFIVFFYSYVAEFFQYLATISGVPLPSYTIFIPCLYFLSNLIRALRPLLRQSDNITDIPLTPRQRQLLGLDPKIESPATPGNDYITPPKYRISATSPQSGTPQSGRSFSSPYSSSPLSGRGPSPTPYRTASRGPNESTFSPSGSPLYHKAIGQEKEGGNRRLTFGTPSPTSLGRSLSLKDSASTSSFKMRGPSTPSPGGGQGRGLNGNVNYKWLYERGAGTPSRRESILA